MSCTNVMLQCFDPESRIIYILGIMFKADSKLCGEILGITPFIIYNTSLFGMPWWLSGGVITLLLALPVVILVARNGLKTAMPIAMMSVVLGTLIGIVGHYWIVSF